MPDDHLALGIPRLHAEVNRRTAATVKIIGILVVLLRPFSVQAEDLGNLGANPLSRLDGEPIRQREPVCANRHQ